MYFSSLALETWDEVGNLSWKLLETSNLEIVNNIFLLRIIFCSLIQGLVILNPHTSPLLRVITLERFLLVGIQVRSWLLLLGGNVGFWGWSLLSVKRVICFAPWGNQGHSHHVCTASVWIVILRLSKIQSCDWGSEWGHLEQVIQTHCRQVVVPFQAARGFWWLHTKWSSFMFQLLASWKWETWTRTLF